VPDQPVIGRFLLPLLPHALVIGVIAGVVWWIDDNAADRTRSEIESQLAKAKIDHLKDLRESEQRLVNVLNKNAVQVSAQLNDLDTRHRTIIQPTLIKELTRETRLSDPAAGITDGVREQLNRSLPPVSCTSTAGGGIRCALPDAQPAPHE
jgi:hypothetical protein